MRPAPDRWIIFRICTSFQNAGDQSSKPVIEHEAFILESDRIRNINDPDIYNPNDQLNVDIENLASAFIANSDVPLDVQHRVYLGLKSKLKDYQPNPSAPRRSPFTLLESSNQFFADFQPHNISVFSLHDDLGGSDSLPMDPATVSYLVFGLHAEKKNDPLSLPEAANLPNCPTNAKLLKACSLTLNPSVAVGEPTVAAFLSAKASETTRTICHGSLNNVRVSRKQSPELIIPSIILQSTIQNTHPIAIGTNTLDALVAYLHVGAAPASDSQMAAHTMLANLDALILGDDDIDSQMKAIDSIASGDWIPHSAEVIWKVSTETQDDKTNNQKPPPLDDVGIKTLNDLNEAQRAINGCEREMAYLKHLMFCKWWNTVVARNSRGNRDALLQRMREDVGILVKRIETLEKTMKDLRDSTKFSKEKLSLTGHAVQYSTSSPFVAHKDPTVLFAGVTSGWPKGFAEPATARLANQLNISTEKAGLKGIFPLFEEKLGFLKKHFPDFEKVVESLTGEWAYNYQREKLKLGDPSWPLPMYMNDEDDYKNTQGWFPIFLEWDVEYYHIPWNLWILEQDERGTWEYKFPPDIRLSETKVGADCRILSGRTIIAPQVSSTLKTRIAQLLAQTNPADLAKILSPSEQKELLDNVAKMEFFSCPLAGIGDHLLTLLRGAHASPFKAHGDIAKQLGVGEKEVKYMSDASDATPYGELKKLSPHYHFFSPFKPVTHGQFRFTKLNLVDKFGQLVVGVEPGKLDGTPPGALYPCTSAHVSCNQIPGTLFPNTAVKADQDEGLCQFFQLQPRINQDARLNAHYLAVESKKTPGTPTPGTTTLRPVTEWENPLWGWVMVNYLDSSLQVFNPDGSFVREVFILPSTSDGKTTETSAFRLHSARTQADSPRLSSFIEQLASNSFAAGIFHMLSGAIDAVGSTPAAYSQALPGTYGKPFCLADIGISIELATPPMSNQSLINTLPPDIHLEEYEFNFALGNANLSYDGLVGFFAAEETPIGRIYSAFGVPPDWDRTYSIIEPPPKQTLRPYHLPGDTPNLAESHYNKLQVFSVFVDPVTPTHIYTGGLLPMKALQLPRWSVDGALQNMHAFFKVGPLLVPEMPPADILRIQNPDAAKDNRNVRIPVLGQDSWEWLNPRLDGDSTTWDSFPVAGGSYQLNLEDLALTEVVEGYLYMKDAMELGNSK